MNIGTGVIPGRGGSGHEEVAAFPTIVDGELRGFQFRRLHNEREPRFLTSPGAQDEVWNHDVLHDRSLDQEPLIITEGRCDALTAIQLNFPRTISAPGGGSDTAKGHQGSYPWLDQLVDKIGTTREIILAGDGDTTGASLAKIMARRLGDGRCRILDYPDGLKDLNDVLQAKGPRVVIDTIKRADWLPVAGVYTMPELPREEPRVSCISGMPGLENHWRLRTGDMTVVTGWPGCGKTSFLNDLAYRMALNHGWRTCFASFEQPTRAQHIPALRQLVTRKRPENQTHEQRTAADDWITRHFSWVQADMNQPTDLVWLLNCFATSIIRHRARICILDPWNELEHSVPRHETMTQYVGGALRMIKHFARRWDVHMIVAAHPAKPTYVKSGEALPEPHLWQISDSQHWWNKPDVGVVIDRQTSSFDKQPVTSVRIAKSKYEDEIGVPGQVGMTFDRVTKSYFPAPL